VDAESASLLQRIDARHHAAGETGRLASQTDNASFLIKRITWMVLRIAGGNVEPCQSRASGEVPASAEWDLSGTASGYP